MGNGVRKRETETETWAVVQEREIGEAGKWRRERGRRFGERWWRERERERVRGRKKIRF